VRVDAHHAGVIGIRFMIGLFFWAGWVGCSLFETREPEQPTQSSSRFDEPYESATVISNLRSAIEQKNTVNYMKCFANPQTSTRPFVFKPSSDGASLSSWTLEDERIYFQNLMASTGDRFSQLQLTLRNTPLPLDTVRYDYGYVLTILHSKAGVPTTVKGHMELALARQSNAFWAIYEWSDHKDSSLTWTRLKVEFL
jgi:hypothetical protein